MMQLTKLIILVLMLLTSVASISQMQTVSAERVKYCGQVLRNILYLIQLLAVIFPKLAKRMTLVMPNAMKVIHSRFLC